MAKTNNSTSKSGLTSSTGSEKYPVRNEHYALISTMYHMLQGYDTFLKYEEDVRAAGNDELVTLFQNMKKDHEKWVGEIKKHLRDWLSTELEDDEMVGRKGQSMTQQADQSERGMHEGQTTH